MEAIISGIVNVCIKKEIISVEYAEWFRYSLEKRLLSIVVGVPFFLVAVWLSGIWTAVFFYFSFYYLRSRMNGYHAKSIGACLITSLLLELLFLGIINTVIGKFAAAGIMVVVIAAALFLAPYNHPNMHLSEEEYAACKKSTRIRIAILSAGFVLTLITEWEQIMRGVTLGSAMAGSLLGIAYILEWRINYGKQRNKTESEASRHCKQDD